MGGVIKAQDTLQIYLNPSLSIQSQLDSLNKNLNLSSLQTNFYYERGTAYSGIVNSRFNAYYNLLNDSTGLDTLPNNWYNMVIADAYYSTRNIPYKLNKVKNYLDNFIIVDSTIRLTFFNAKMDFIDTNALTEHLLQIKNGELHDSFSQLAQVS